MIEENDEHIKDSKAYFGKRHMDMPIYKDPSVIAPPAEKVRRRASEASEPFEYPQGQPHGIFELQDLR